MIKIVKDPDPILRQKTKNVEKIDAKFLRLIDEMWEVIEDKGVGLAAPQVGKGLNFSVIGFNPTEERLKKDPDLIVIPKMVLINPCITWKSKGVSVEKEGCLSIDKIEVSVPRHKKVHIKYQDLKLKRQTIKAKGYFARVLQHETDHLCGKLITDYK